MYNTPAAESEYSLFHVMDDGGDYDGHARIFPFGGHNYYHGRDMERFIRRTRWLFQAKPMQDDWEDRYMAIVSQPK